VTRVAADGAVPPETGSQLALEPHTLEAGSPLEIDDPGWDSLLIVVDGAGALELDGAAHTLGAGTCALVVAGERATVTGDGSAPLRLLHGTVGPDGDRHAPMGEREVVVRVEDAARAGATGKRSFQLLFGPHNGSTRATLFAGQIPPGRAPWHYHLYDEIVWVPAGPGRLHLEQGAEQLGAGAAFRLHPREVHIVENAGADELAVIGLFTPAGSPSAAYLPAGVTAGYAVSAV
jgi:quercetin dioxygenase-like cupin family protein